MKICANLLRYVRIVSAYLKKQITEFFPKKIFRQKKRFQPPKNLFRRELWGNSVPRLFFVGWFLPPKTRHRIVIQEGSKLSSFAQTQGLENVEKLRDSLAPEK